MRMEKPPKTGIKRDEKGRIVRGSAGPTLKEFARRMLMTMDDEEKLAYLRQLPPEIVWKMAEGNPHTTNDVTSDGNPLAPVLVRFIDAKDGKDD